MATGHDLKVMRVRENIRATVLADRLGISSGRLSQVENSIRVSPQWRHRYIKTLEELTND